MSNENDSALNSLSTLGEPIKGQQRRDIERTLSAVLKSEQFASAPQLGDFLQFIVRKTLDGEANQIKAYTIATDALGRNEDFDPQTNAAVRVAAGRLRQALALYRADAANQKNPIRIELAPGSYVPAFLPNQVDAPAEAEEQEIDAHKLISIDDPQMKESVLELVEKLEDDPLPVKRSLKLAIAAVVSAAITLTAVVVYLIFPDFGTQTSRQAQNGATTDSPGPVASINIEKIRPRIKLSVLLPDSQYPDWFKSGELTDSIVLAISRFDDYEFVSAYVGDAPQLSETNSADYHLLTSAYNRGSRVRVFGRLLREKDGTVIWSTERSFEEPRPTGVRNVPELAGETFSPVGSPYGVIYADLLSKRDHREPLGCIISGYEYFNNKTTTGHAEARRCSERLVQANARIPSLLAMLTFLYLDEHRENRNPRERSALEAAEKTALDAIAFGPTSARAHQALFAVRKVQGDFSGARTMAETAYRLNPYDTDIISDYGAWLISVGDFGKGRQLLGRAERLLGSHPAWVEVFRFLSHELEGNTKRADTIAQTFDYSRSPMTAMAVAISASRAGDLNRAKRALDSIEEVDPQMLKNVKVNLLKRGFAPGVADILETRFERARSRVGN